jgi:hypothetical protein
MPIFRRIEQEKGRDPYALHQVPEILERLPRVT